MIHLGNIEHTDEKYILNIRDKHKAIKAQYALDVEDVEEYVLRSEHNIKISFEFNRKINFIRGDYIEYNGSRYILRARYKPVMENTGKYSYSMQFDHEIMLLQDIDFYYVRQKIKEINWSLTSNAPTFMEIVVGEINRYFKTDKWKVGTVEPPDSKYLSFNQMKVFDALNYIADEFKAEWYATDYSIHLVNKLAFGSEVEFEVDRSIVSITTNEGENTPKYNRIVALGSQRNIPTNYRETEEGEGLDAIYQKRLRIPISKGSEIDAFENMSAEEIVEGSVIFEDVFPKRIGKMSSITSTSHSETDPETGEVTKWLTFRFKDTGLVFKEAYLLPDIDLRLSFHKSKRLNNLDFGVKYNPDGKPESNPESQVFQIIFNEDYGKLLPNETLYPEEGDEYILYGFNIQLVADQYIPEAEAELYETAVQWMKDNLKDKSQHLCQTLIDYFEEKNLDLEIGQKIKLINNDFEDGYRSSRIMGFKKKLMNKYDCVYTIGDNPTYKRFDRIEKEIRELKFAGITYQSSGQSGVYLIKQYDSTAPTEHNAYSSKASDARYFNKVAGGSILGNTVIHKNLLVQESIISDRLQNSSFSAGQFGSGYQIKKAINGQTYMEIDNLLVRRESVFNRLTIGELKSVGATVILSLASQFITQVEEKSEVWKCNFDNANGSIPNNFQINDQVICQRYAGNNRTYYWALVTGVGPDYVEISKTVKEGTSNPQLGDELIQLGNRSDVNRQHAIVLSAYGSDAPSFKQYSSINSFDLSDKEVTRLSPTGNKIAGEFVISSHGTSSPILKDREFVAGFTYFLNDRVSYDSAYWVCKLSSTIEIPTDSSLAWQRETTSQTLINEGLASITHEFNSKLHIQNDKIETKVERVDFNLLGQRVGSAEAKILHESNRITTSVRNLETTIGNTASNKVRYIRDWLNGSTANLGNHWVEIQANNLQDENIALGKSLLESTSTLVTNGNTNHTPHLYMGNDILQALTVDLGGIHELKDVTVWHYWADGRSYFKTKTEVSADGKVWRTLFDSDSNTTYKEEAEGKKHFLNDSLRVEKEADLKIGITESQITHTNNRITSEVRDLNTRITTVGADGQLYCRGTGGNREATRMLHLNGKDVYSGGGGRGLYLTVIRRADLVLLSNHSYDVYAGETPRVALINKLNSLTDSDLIVLTSYDAIIIDNPLAQALEGCGGSGITLNGRHPYVLVGIPNIGKSNGIENYRGTAATEPFAEISTRIIKGIPTGINTIGNTLGNLQTTINTKIDQTSSAIRLAAERAQTTADGKASIVDVANSITIGQDNIHIAGKMLNISSPMIAKSIESDELKVGKNPDNTFNFRVGTDGKVYAKGATIAGKLQTAESGERILFNTDTNSISVIDNDDNVKVIIKPTALTKLSNILQRTIFFGAQKIPLSYDVFSSDERERTISEVKESDIINLPEGLLFDLIHPNMTFKIAVQLRDEYPPQNDNYYPYPYGNATAEIKYELRNIDKPSKSYTIYDLKLFLTGQEGQYKSEDRKISQSSPILHAIQGGKYRLRVYCYLKVIGSSRLSAYAYGTVSIAGITWGFARSFTQFTELAKDGITSIFGSRKYIHITEDAALFRYGEFGFRVSERGIETTKNGSTWNKLV